MTNPDTNTLNGSLEQLGITMAANLTTMGVPSTYDEGLTTLARKILNISPGPIPASISLTADKSILSYEDGESAVLSATVLDEDSQAVEGATVEFFNGSTSMGTATTNSSGVATKSYSSSGAGDLSFTASVGSLVSETYDIQDCDISRPTEISKNGQNMQIPLFNDYSFVNNGDWELSCDLKVNRAFLILTPCSNESMSTNDCNVYVGIGANNSSSNLKICALGFSPTISDGAIWDTNHGGYGSDYHTVKITRIGNKYTFYYDDSELTNTTSVDFSAQTPLYLAIRTGASNDLQYVKNLKIKPL